MPQNDFQGTTLFLKDEKGRKDVKASPEAMKSKASGKPNLAIYGPNGELNEVVKHVLDIARSAKAVYEQNRTWMFEKWTKADNFYWMKQKDHRLPELSRAKVSASSFYRATRRLSDGAYLTTFEGDELPTKFFPAIDPFDPTDLKAVKAAKADAVNRYAKKCFEKQKIKQDPKKAKRAYHLTYKYATMIAYVPYDFQIEKRKRYEDVDVNEPIQAADGSTAYKNKETGEISPEPFPPKAVEVEYDYVCKDEVGFYPRDIQNIWLDDRIEDIDRQTALLDRDGVIRSEMWAEALAGNYKNIDKVTEAQKYQLYGWESEIENQRRSDANKDISSSSETEMYERWKCWLMLPKIEVKFNSKGEPSGLKWDINAEPRRYLLELIGPITGDCVVVRFQESIYWRNTIPYIKANSHDDDCGFYARGLVDLLEDNWIQESVAKGQLMDNRCLLMRRPMQWLKGRVMNKSGKIDYNTIFTVTSQDAIKQMDVSDFTGNISQSLNYLETESENISQIPKFMIGQGIGARTSATEFAAIRDSGSAPALTDIKILNMQIWGGYMRKVLEYIPQFVSEKLITEMDGQTFLLKPDSIVESDFDLKEVAIQEFDNKQTTRQVLTNTLTPILQSPMFQPVVNPAGLFVRIMSLYPEVSPNPEELLIKNEITAMLLKEWQTQQQQQPPEQQAAPQPVPGLAGNMEGQMMSGPAGAMGGM